MKKNLLLFFCLLICVMVSNLQAQQILKRTCGTMDHLDLQKSKDPNLAARMEAIENHTALYVQNQRNANLSSTPIVTIPVVFHIVYKTGAQNISDAKCIAQLNQLNLDYAKLNTDTNTVPAVFRGLAADTKIQFCLAQRDPNGNATTGIVRKQTTVTSFVTDDKVKSSTTGGDNAWPASSYLNLWVCNLGNSLLGYAQFPGGSPSTDGVVLLYSSVGSMLSPGTSSPYNLGRTATHEVGHWLNLRHIWGDANCGNDQVADTPPAKTSNFGCKTFPFRSTGCNTTTNGEMFMNYMDYTDDACMQMFTQGQSTRMTALFSPGGSRASLLNSLGCQPPASGGGSFSFNNVASTNVACGAPSASSTLVSAAMGGFTAPITLSAIGAPTGTSVTFSANPLTPGNSTTVTLSNMNSLAPGTYTITVTGTATGSANQTANISFVVNPGVSPVITTQPSNISVCTGGNVTFTSATSTANVNYQWMLSIDGGTNYINIQNANSSTFTISNVANSLNNNKYKVVMTTACGLSTSNVATLTVNELEVLLTANPENVALTPGRTVMLKATVIPASTYNLVWRKDGSIISSNNNIDSLLVYVDQIGTYTVEAIDPNGFCSRVSNPLTVTDSVSGRIFIFPNPTSKNGNFTVSYYNKFAPNKINKQTVSIFESHGARVFEKTFDVNGGYSRLNISVPNLSAGAYIVVLRDGYGNKLGAGTLFVNQ